jgi:hypothetical protein
MIRGASFDNKLADLETDEITVNTSSSMIASLSLGTRVFYFLDKFKKLRARIWSTDIASVFTCVIVRG